MRHSEPNSSGKFLRSFVESLHTRQTTTQKFHWLQMNDRFRVEFQLVGLSHSYLILAANPVLRTFHGTRWTGVPIPSLSRVSFDRIGTQHSALATLSKPLKNKSQRLPLVPTCRENNSSPRNDGPPFTRGNCPLVLGQGT